MEKKNNNMCVLLTGGHVTPAYAVIEELQKKGFSNLYFVGRKFTDRSNNDVSFEYKEVTALGVKFYNLTTGRLSRTFGLKSLFDVIATFYGFFLSLVLIIKIKPKVIMSFGGYIAFPICIVGWLLGIKIITHEQTIAPGISNRIIGNIADKVLVSFAETAHYFDKHKTIHTGNPIRTKLLTKGTPLLKGALTKPLLFITGGSLGSHSINIRIEQILPHLLENFVIVHQVGNVSEFQDYERLSKRGSDDYLVYKNLTVDEMAWAYAHSDAIVARSGANTLWELIMLKKPAVLVPLPWSGRDEQRKQATFFSNSGLGEVYDQLEPAERLLEKINKVHRNFTLYKKSFSNLPQNFILPAAESIADIIEECAS